MKYNSVYERDSSWIFIHPVFEEESPKEKKAVSRLNEFFNKAGKAIIDYTSSDDFPEGGKFFAECIFLSENDQIKCEFILKQRGRTLRRKTILYTTQKGYIISLKII